MYLYFALSALLLQQALSHPVPNGKKTQHSAPLVKLRLDSVRSTSFTVHFYQNSVIPYEVKLVPVATYAVQTQRPNLVRVLDLTATWKSTHIQLKDGSLVILPSQSYVSDGKQALTWYIGFPKPNIAPFAAGDGNFTTLGETPGPHVFYPVVLFTPDALTRLKFKYYGEQIVQGKPVAEYRSKGDGYKTIVLYLNRQTRLPERVSTFRLEGVGDWTEEYRAEFSDWKFDITFPPDTFDLKQAAVTLKPYVSRK